MEIKIIKGDITELDVEAIVNPANSFMSMGGGLALIIKRKGGDEIEREAKRFAPVPVGKAIITKAGKLKAKYVIHAPTMHRPMRIPPENVYQATKAAMKCAIDHGIESLAIPALGTGVGAVTKEEAAKQIIQALKEIAEKQKPRVIVYLIAYDDEQFNAFNQAYKEIMAQ